jgi:mono/diheme cytochrome c family protein
VALALVGAGGAAHAQAEPEAPNPGREAFLQYCASCHGARGDGKGPMAGELRQSPADLRHLTGRFGSPLQTQRLLERIDGRRMARAHGSRDMPVWGEKLTRNIPHGAGTEAQTRGTLLIIIDWLESIQEGS